MLSAETELLFSTAGAEQHVEMRRLLRGPLDWPRLVLIAERERAAGVLWRRLAGSGIELPPEAGRLQAVGMITDFTVSVLQDRLARTVSALRAAGVDFVLLKGAALAQTVYADPRDRPMYDIDILVRPAQVAAAVRAVRGAGWVHRTGAPGAAYDAHQHLPPFDDASGTGISLELHRELLPDGHPFGLTGEGVMARAVAATVAGHRVLVPSPEDQLCHTCVHFAWSHRMLSGIWRTARDVGAVARAGVDWPAFVARARESRALAACYWTFRLSRRLGLETVPDEVIQALRPPGSRVSHRLLERHFVLGLVYLDARWCPSARLTRRMWEAGMRPEWSGHGRVRPWQFEVSVDPPEAPVPAGRRLLASAARHRRQAGQWWRYVLGCVAGARP